MGFFTEKETQRFAQKTRWLGKCLIWTGSINSDGYGTLTMRRQSFKAHRLAYIDAWGEIPAGLVVRHRCDNPACVNPAHLELGTDADNARDKAVRHRTKTKITDDQVRSIRSDSRRLREIASDFNISASAVCLIKAGRRRQHVGV